MKYCGSLEFEANVFSFTHLCLNLIPLLPLCGLEYSFTLPSLIDSTRKDGVRAITQLSCEMLIKVKTERKRRQEKAF